MLSPRRALTGSIAALFALAAPGAPADEPGAVPAEIANITISGTEYGAVQLTDGAWEGEPWSEGGASRPRVGLASDFIRFGDVDADGSDEALVIVWQSAGGSGTFNYIALVDEIDGAWRNTATAALGDRVRVTDASIGRQGVDVQVIEHDEDDAACCPTREATRRYDTRLVPLPNTEDES